MSIMKKGLKVNFYPFDEMPFKTSAANNSSNSRIILKKVSKYITFVSLPYFTFPFSQKKLDLFDAVGDQNFLRPIYKNLDQSYKIQGCIM